MVHSRCTDPTQATMRLVIVLVSRKQKRGTGDNNFVKLKGTFWFEWPKWLDQSKWTTIKAGPEYSGQTKPKWSIPLILMYQPKINFRNFGLNRKCPFCKICNVCKPYQTRSWKWFGIKYEGLKGHSWMRRSKNGVHITVAILGHVTLHMIYWTPLLIKSAFVWKVILGVRDLTKYSVRFRRTQNFLTGYRIWLLLRTWDLPKSWQVLGEKMIFWDRDLFIQNRHLWYGILVKKERESGIRACF